MRVNMPVHVEWVGHGCFRIRREGGPTIVTDPYTQRNVSLPEDTTIEGDTVIVSSLTDRAHGNPKLVRGNPRVINALDLAVAGTEAQVEGSPLITLKVRESEMHESGSPKDNAMYALKVGGLWILHMGDLGYGLSAEEMAPFVGRCDLLLALVGQTNTITLKDLDFLIDHLKPKWIVPMHYLLWWPSKMRPLGEFLVRRRRDPLIYARSSTVKFPLETPGVGRPIIIVLEPSGCPAELRQSLQDVSPAGNVGA